MALAAERLVVMQPLPLVPPGAVAVADGVALLEDGEGSGTVFIWGQAAWTWDLSDVGARRLAAVQLVNCGAADQRQVAAAFAVNETTVWRWRSDYKESGLASLLPRPMGPKRPSKLTEDTRAAVHRLRAAGKTIAEVAEATRVSEKSVRRVIAPAVLPDATPRVPVSDLVVLAKPEDRSAEREAAHRGTLAEAAPVICRGASLPFVGALIILPALSATGLLEVTTAVYGAGRRVAGQARAAFYGLRSLVLCVVFSLLLGEPRAEGLTRLDPVAIGRLLGLDRAPEVSRLRFRLSEVASEERSDELLLGLARRHVEAHPEAVGLLYVDGHVRAYHGSAEIGKAHVARMRIAMPAEIDTWICDRFGDGLLVWQAPPGASLTGELKLVAGKVRALLGEDARPTIAFDRGGWSPKLFAELKVAGFDILTYKKGPTPPEEPGAFLPCTFTDEAGRTHEYLLCDRKSALGYDNNRRSFDCRQITRLDEATGHQTQIITTRDDPDPALIAHAMFSRWRQENFFRYLRQHYGLDALDAYETTPDDPDRPIANPARRDADRAVREARATIADAEAKEGRSALEGRQTTPELAVAFAEADAELDRRAAHARSLPAKVALFEVRPNAVRLGTERKRVMDAIRMATYNAESCLARLIAPHYARAEDEARSLLREIFRSSADLEIEGHQLRVRIDPLSAPRRTRALAGLCEELTATETVYPGTKLTLVYLVKEA
jgi:transposase-like protein